MRQSNFKYISILLVLLTISSTHEAKAQLVRDTVYISDTIYVANDVQTSQSDKYKKRWHRLIPSHIKTQFAGSMGLMSFGAGWSYGKSQQWETEILGGFVPRYSSKHAKGTLTLKQNYIPWRVPVYKGLYYRPLSTGLYLNTVFGDEYWGSQPSKYPNGYYTFSTKVRFNIFVGQEWEYRPAMFKNNLFKSFSFAYELSTNDLYIITAYHNRHMGFEQFLGLSLALKANFK